MSKRVSKRAENMRRRLQDRRNQIVEPFQRVRETHLLDASNTPADEAEEAEGRFDRDVMATTSDTWSKELANIETALINLDNGQYGMCAECGSDIPQRRLLSMPSTSLCINCQEKCEREARQWPTRPSWPAGFGSEVIAAAVAE